MSTHGKARARKAARRKQQQQRTLIIAGAVGAVILIALAAILIGGAGSAAPPVEDSRLTLDPYLGDPNAPVTIVEYGAYGCPACRAWHEAGIIEQILAAYPGQVRFTFRDYPVISPAYDRMAAELAQCALDQDEDLYWAYHNALYTRAQVGDSRDTLIALAGEVGLDTDALQACADAGTHRATVQYDEDRARRLGLRGTPSFTINGSVVYNASPETLQAAITRALSG